MELTHTATIDKPVGVVFAAAADPEEQLKWDPDMLKSVEKVSHGPVAKGSRYRGKFAGFGTVTYEFSEYDPGRRFQHLTKMPFGTMRHTFKFDAAGDGTRITQTLLMEPNLLGRLMTPVIKAQMTKRLAQIPEELRAYLT